MLNPPLLARHGDASWVTCWCTGCGMLGKNGWGHENKSMSYHEQGLASMGGVLPPERRWSRHCGIVCLKTLSSPVVPWDFVEQDLWTTGRLDHTAPKAVKQVHIQICPPALCFRTCIRAESTKRMHWQMFAAWLLKQQNYSSGPPHRPVIGTADWPTGMRWKSPPGIRSMTSSMSWCGCLRLGTVTNQVMLWLDQEESLDSTPELFLPSNDANMNMSSCYKKISFMLP